MYVADEGSPRSQFLTFRVAEEAYAVPILRVREIINHREPTRVPMTPPHVPGVINLRGTVVPLVDLALKFGGAPTTISKRSCIVIAELMVDGEATAMGLLVDAVDEVAQFGPGDTEAPPPFGLGISAELLQGMGRRDGHFVPILDIDRVLAVEARAAAEGADAAIHDEPDPAPGGAAADA